MKTATVARLGLTLSLACAGVFSANSADAVTCPIGFNQSTVLRSMPAAQAYGFALAPWYSAICGGMNFVDRFVVDENGGSINGHYHIWAEDPTVNCFTTTSTWPDGVMGRQSGSGACVAVDPFMTPRTAAVHLTSHWLRVRSTNSNRWRPIGIKVLGTAAIKVLVEHTDGTFWQYTNLTPGTWGLGVTGKFAKNAWVMNQNTNGSPMSFDNFVVDHHL